MPWVVRWRVDGQQRSRAFRTKAEADNVRSRLVVAVRDGERFDRVTGEPESWGTAPDERPVFRWAREWLAEQWSEWQPRTRASAIEAMSRFIPLVHHRDGPDPPEELRSYLVRALDPAVAIDSEDRCERWMQRWSPPLNELDRELMAGVERRLAIGLHGQSLSASVASRYRKVAHACLVRAVDLNILKVDPWPPPPRGRSNRKSTRRQRSVDVRVLPDPSAMASVIAALPSHQPASRMYQVMTGVTYYAGLRPSEVVMLRTQALRLPASGWGHIDVIEADIGWDETGEPKTGPRRVPIPPRLVAMLSSWVASGDYADDALIFRTRGGKRPTPSNWSRALKRALRTAGCRPMRVYDCRHAAATAWLRAGVPLGDVAKRMGHSVDTLVSTYVGALEGDEQIANERIELLLEVGPEPLAGSIVPRSRSSPIG